MLDYTHILFWSHRQQVSMTGMPKHLHIDYGRRIWHDRKAQDISYIDYGFSWVSSVLPSKYLDSASSQAITTSFCIFSSSLFSNHQYCIVWATDSVSWHNMFCWPNWWKILSYPELSSCIIMYTLHRLQLLYIGWWLMLFDMVFSPYL